MIPLTNAQRDLAGLNLGLARIAARKVWDKSHHIPDLADLQQAAMVGLCQAARGFDASLGLQFSTYASPACYHAAISEAVTQGVIYLPLWVGRPKQRGNPLLKKAGAARYPMQFVMTHHDTGRSDSQAADDRQDIDIMLQAIGPNDRELVRQRMAGQTYKAIGKAAGMSGNGAKQRINNALEAIRKRFG